MTDIAVENWHGFLRQESALAKDSGFRRGNFFPIPLHHLRLANEISDHSSEQGIAFVNNMNVIGNSREGFHQRQMPGLVVGKNSDFHDLIPRKVITSAWSWRG